MILVLELDAEPTSCEVSLLRASWLRCPLAEEGSRLQVRVRGQVSREYQYPLLIDRWDGPGDWEPC